MYERISVLRKARTVVIVAAGVIAVGVALVTPSALAGKVVPVTEPIQFHNASCGADTGGAQIGSVTFSRAKGKLQVDVTFQRADASTEYAIDLWDGSTCTFITEVGGVFTNGSGDGSGTFQAKVRGRVFFVNAVDVADVSQANDSLIATLG
jgi:hypothetical protein